MGKPKLSSFVVLRAKTIGGRKFRIGERLPVGHVSVKKLVQMQERGFIANLGEDMGRELAKKYEHAFVKRDASSD